MPHSDRIASIRLKPCEHPECPYARCDDAHPVPPGSYRAATPAPPPPVLSGRQREIVLMLIEDRTHKEIGKALGITEKMVTVHRANIFAKLGIHGLAALTRRALLWGWIEPAEDAATRRPHSD